MVQSFSFTHTPDIIFGAGKIKALPGKIKLYNGNVLLLHGLTFNQRDKGKTIIDELKRSDIDFFNYTVKEEPTPAIIDVAVKEFKSKEIKVVVAIGGGSVIDAGKAISAMLSSEGKITDYLEGVGTMDPTGNKVPFIAIPTTSGTGSEMTKNAVITQPGDDGFKKSLRHDNYVPDIALIDPELMVSCPPDVTAATGLDAFCQLLESYLSTSASQLTNVLALQGMILLVESLPKAFQDGNDIQARSDVAYAAMLSGITLANAGLGVVHGFAQPLGFLYPIPHGLVCGSLLYQANKVTLDQIKDDRTYSGVLNLYTSLGMYLFGPSLKIEHAADMVLSVIKDLCNKVEIPGLSKYNIKESDYDKIISLTGLKNHPYPLNSCDLKEILEKSM